MISVLTTLHPPLNLDYAVRSQIHLPFILRLIFEKISILYLWETLGRQKSGH
jgi:hypothetical protein